ncbi:hypothetical protein HC761_00390 [bacterium]|nr:hypothetical protein [bacterium]
MPSGSSEQIFISGFEAVSTGTTAVEVTDKWFFDRDAGSTKLGLVLRTQRTATGTSKPVLTSYFSYDNLGRLSNQLEDIGPGDYSQAMFYDSLGRVNRKTVFYGLGITGLIQGEQYRFNARGYAHQVCNDNPSNDCTGANLLHTLKLQNARGQTSEEQHASLASFTSTRTYDLLGRVQSITSGNASGPAALQDWLLTHDAAGNVSQRWNKRRNQIEDAIYDRLDRMTSISSNWGPANLALSFDQLGNDVQ